MNGVEVIMKEILVSAFTEMTKMVSIVLMIIIMMLAIMLGNHD